MEGAVNGGTFSSLVERMTIYDQASGTRSPYTLNHGIVDTVFMNAFLLTFHLFGGAEQLFTILSGHFTMPPPPGLSGDEYAIWSEKKQRPIQTRVAVVLRTWLESFWVDSLDDVCLDDIYSFANDAMMGPQPDDAQQVLQLVAVKVCGFCVFMDG